MRRTLLGDMKSSVLSGSKRSLTRIPRLAAVPNRRERRFSGCVSQGKPSGLNRFGDGFPRNASKLPSGIDLSQ